MRAISLTTYVSTTRLTACPAHRSDPDWYEGAIARPDLALRDFASVLPNPARALLPAAYDRVWLRRYANESQATITARDCAPPVPATPKQPTEMPAVPNPPPPGPAPAGAQPQCPGTYSTSPRRRIPCGCQNWAPGILRAVLCRTISLTAVPWAMHLPPLAVNNHRRACVSTPPPPSNAPMQATRVALAPSQPRGRRMPARRSPSRRSWPWRPPSHSPRPRSSARDLVRDRKWTNKPCHACSPKVYCPVKNRQC
jgi:hypothetical protein